MQVKKIWKWVVVATLVAALSVPYVSAAGTDEDAPMVAAKRLLDLKLITGRANGDLALDENITRAELIVVLVKSFGQEEAAKKLQGTASFKDSQKHWASGYIAMAKKLVEKNGDTMGATKDTFAPNGNVTPAQAVAFMMKFLGVKPETGTAWPNNYLNVAVQTGLITAEERDTIVEEKNTNANRGLVFYLADTGFSNYELPGGKTVYTTFVDKTAPSLAVDALPAETDQAKITLKGTASGATTVTIDGNVVVVGADGKWSGTLTLKSGENTYDIVASDVAGNSTAKQVKVKMTGVTDDVY